MHKRMLLILMGGKLMRSKILKIIKGGAIPLPFQYGDNKKALLESQFKGVAIGVLDEHTLVLQNLSTMA